jgi:ureidoglycolate lyase
MKVVIFMATYTVIAEDLVPENFSPFGQAIQRPAGVAPKRGDDWDCWVPLARLGLGDPSIGIVSTRPTEGIIRAMEREPKTEFLLPISGPVIQAVAPRGDAPEYQSQPEANAVRAFVIWPGQAIVMAPGTWHWAALPLRDEEVLYFFATEISEVATQAAVNPWVPFKGRDVVRVIAG